MGFPVQLSNKRSIWIPGVEPPQYPRRSIPTLSKAFARDTVWIQLKSQMIKSVGNVPKMINDLSLSEERKHHSFSVIRLGSRPLIFQPSQLFSDSSNSVHTRVCMWCSWTATFNRVNYAATASLSACTMAQSSGSPLLSRLRWPISGQFIMRLLLQRMMSIVSIAFVSVGSNRQAHG